MALDRTKVKSASVRTQVVPRPTSLPRHEGPLNLPPTSSSPAPKILVRVRQQVPESKGKKVGQVAKAAGPITLLHDDFTVANLADPACPWSTGFPWGQTLNAELQYYTRYDKNFFTNCQKGNINHDYKPTGTLSLLVKYEPNLYEVWEWPNQVFTPTCKPYNYTSAMLWSKQKFLYGHFEIKCKIPFNGTTLFPAFWLWAGDPYREIDIFEFEHPTIPNRLLTNIHIDRSLDFERTNHDPGNSGPINDYGAQTLLPDVSGFHVYAVQWRPNSVTWLVDGSPVRILAGHSPPLDMHLIVNVALASWRTPPSSSHFPSGMEIDYVRVDRLTDPEFLYGWGNQGDGKIAAWNLKASDQMIAGQFSGGPRTQLLAVAANGWSHLMRWDGSSWQYVWGNNGANQIALWKMRPDDRYLAGDFNGDGRDEILVIAANNGWSHLMRWDGSAWQYMWGNNGDNQVGLWQLRPTDRYFVGDFEGTGRSQLAAISNHGWAHAMFWSGSAWQYMWGNDGGGTIHRWFMNPADRYTSGSFDGGKSLALATAANGWAHLLKFEPVP